MKFKRWLEYRHRAEVLPNGKYKEQAFADVYEADKNYCQWVLKAEDAGMLRPFQAWLRLQPLVAATAAGDGDDRIMSFGKYKGRPFREVLADESYCQWILQEGG